MKLKTLSSASLLLLLSLSSLSLTRSLVPSIQKRQDGEWLDTFENDNRKVAEPLRRRLWSFAPPPDKRIGVAEGGGGEGSGGEGGGGEGGEGEGSGSSGSGDGGTGSGPPPSEGAGAAGEGGTAAGGETSTSETGGDTGTGTTGGTGTQSVFDPLPPGAPLPAGRVPGQNVLPLEIPDFVGLEPGNPGARSYQIFLNWDLQGSRLAPENAHYLLFYSDQARSVRATFKSGFNTRNDETPETPYLYHDGLDPQDSGQLIDFTDIYPSLDDETVFDAPAGKEAWFYSAQQSVGIATRAAQSGGILKVLGPSKAGDSNALDLDTMLASLSYLNKYELWLASNGDGRSLITEIQVYNSGNLGQAPVTIWTQGQAAMGIKPEFVVGPVPDGDEGNEIDLGERGLSLL